MVIGVPNVGKSSLINSLRRQHLRKGTGACGWCADTSIFPGGDVPEEHCQSPADPTAPSASGLVSFSPVHRRVEQ